MRAALAIILTLYAGIGSTHDGHDHGGWLWTEHPLVLGPRGLSGGLYSLGVIPLWRRVSRGRGFRHSQAASPSLGWLLLFGALFSPLHWLGERQFVAHLTEHEVILALAAPQWGQRPQKGQQLAGLWICRSGLSDRGGENAFVAH